MIENPNPSPDLQLSKNNEGCLFAVKTAKNRSDLALASGFDRELVSLNGLDKDYEIKTIERGDEVVFLFPVYVIGDDPDKSYESRRRQSKTLRDHIYKVTSRLLRTHFKGRYIMDFEFIYRELLKNSMDHTPGKAYFTLKAMSTPSKSNIHFALADEGKGISELLSQKTGLLLTFEDAYAMVMREGFSTRTEKTNGGMGLFSIPIISERLNMRISAFENGREFIFSSPDSADPLEKGLFGNEAKLGFHYLATCTQYK